MIEIIENAVQLAVTGICSAICFAFAYRQREREWDILALFYAAIFLGDLYWLLRLLLTQDSPQLPYVSDFAWYAAYLFLLICLRFSLGKEAGQRRHPLLWAVPPFVIAMCLFYMQWGAYLANIISAFLMGLLLWNSLKGVLAGRAFGVAVLVFCLVEYALWTVSCFAVGEGIANPYYWFDFLFTLSMAALLPVFAKEVRA